MGWINEKKKNGKKSRDTASLRECPPCALTSQYVDTLFYTVLHRMPRNQFKFGSTQLKTNREPIPCPETTYVVRQSVTLSVSGAIFQYNRTGFIPGSD